MYPSVLSTDSGGYLLRPVQAITLKDPEIVGEFLHCLRVRPGLQGHSHVHTPHLVARTRTPLLVT